MPQNGCAQDELGARVGSQRLVAHGGIRVMVGVALQVEQEHVGGHRTALPAAPVVDTFVPTVRTFLLP